jgi:UDP-2,3-diacylglucosamine pyrophosphatase LpxH
MKIAIENEIFHDIGEFRNLYRIILNGDQRHVFLIDYPSILKSVNFEKLEPIDQEILSHSYVSNNRTEILPKFTISKVSGSNRFSTDEAILYLDQPLSILLEHGLNDRYFLESLFKNFDEDKDILKHLSKGWIIFDHAGGAGPIKSIINGTFRSMETWPKKDKKVYLRFFVIMDSDKKTNVSPLGTDKENIVKYLTKNEIVHHVLVKREMENYVPESILTTLDNSYLNEYCNLTTIQKDYFDLEKGLIHERGAKKGNNEVEDFYASLNDKSWKILQAGINTDKYSSENFKNEFGKLFNDPTVTKNSLLSRCGGTKYENELQEIVNKVKSLL